MILNHDHKPIEQTSKDRNLTDAIFHECLSENKMPLAGLARKYSANHPCKPTTAQNITNKIARDSMKLREFTEYLELIGFDIMLIPRGETADTPTRSANVPAAEPAVNDSKPITVREIKSLERGDIPFKVMENLESIAMFSSYNLFMRGGIAEADGEDEDDEGDEEINSTMIDVQDIQKMLKIAFLYGMREGRKS